MTPGSAGSPQNRFHVPVALHVISWITLFSAVIAVNSVMADPNFVVGVMLTAAVGQSVSIYMRRRGISSRVLEFTVFAVCVVGYLRTMMTSYDILSFHAGTADSPQIQFAALLTWMEAMRSLTFTSDEAVLFSGVPSLAVIGLAATDNINPDIIGYFVLYLFCVTAMLSQCSQLRLRRHAVSGIPPLSLGAQLRPALVVTIMAFCIGGLIAWPLRYVTVKAIRHQVQHFTPGGPVGILSLRPSSNTVSVLGGPIQARNIQVLSVKASGPCYLRANVFDFYTGQVWERTDKEFRAPERENDQAVPESSLFKQTILLKTGQTTEILGAASPIAVKFHYPSYKDVGQPLVNSDGCWRSERTQSRGMSYDVLSSLPENSPARLASSGTEYPSEIAKMYLQNPSLQTDRPRRIRQLAKEVTRAGANPYEKALAIETYLSRHYKYDLDAPATPRGQDVVEHFLFRSRRGYCTAFASSMVMMLRELGIPARLAVGYAPGMYSAQEKAYQVMEKDRHAWVEAYFAGYGWVAFDPSGAEEVRQPGFWSVVARESRDTFRRLITDRPWLILAVILSLTLIYLARPDLACRSIRLPGRLRGNRGVYGVHQHYTSMCRIAARTGIVRLPSATPSEYATLLKDRLTGNAELAALVDDVTRTFERVKYGGADAERGDVEQMKMNIRRLEDALHRDRRCHNLRRMR